MKIPFFFAKTLQSETTFLGFGMMATGKDLALIDIFKFFCLGNSKVFFYYDEEIFIKHLYQ